MLLTAPFLAQVDATIANVATPSIRSTLHASGAGAQLVVGGYLISYATLLITGARLGQLYGYKRLFLIGIGVFGLTSLLAGLAPDIGLLIAARAVQGVGAAMMYPQSLTGIQLTFTGAARTRAVSLFAIALSGGAVTGQILGGVLISANIAGAQWRPIFLINAPVVVAGLLIGIRQLPADPRRPFKEPTGGGDTSTNLDLAGVAIFVITALLLIVPLIIGPDLHWPIWAPIMLAAALPAGWLFVRSQKRRSTRGRTPLIDIGLLRRRPVLLGILGLLLAVSTYYALLFILAQYIQDGLHHSALTSGLVLVPWVAAFGAAGQITRRLPPRLTPHLPAAGFLLLALANVSIGSVIATRPGLSIPLYVMLGLGGLGLGAGFATVIVHLSNNVDPQHAPDIGGLATTTVQVGGALGIATLGSLYLSLASHPGHALTVAAFTAAAITAAATGAAWAATHRTPEGKQ